MYFKKWLILKNYIFIVDSPKLPAKVQTFGAPWFCFGLLKAQELENSIFSIVVCQGFFEIPDSLWQNMHSKRKFRNSL